MYCSIIQKSDYPTIMEIKRDDGKKQVEMSHANCQESFQVLLIGGGGVYYRYPGGGE